MGREWYLNWGAKSSSKKKSGQQGGAAPAPPPPPPPPGCMSAVSQILDFHPLRLCLHHPHELSHPSPQSDKQPSSSSSSSSPLTGVEAPRNSLETEVGAAAPVPFGLIKVAEELNIPIGVSIKTTTNTRRRDGKLLRVQAPRARDDDFRLSSVSQSETASVSSPAGPRTPTLVARLMGLDLLPEEATAFTSSTTTTTPRPSNAYQLTTTTQTLPITPRHSTTKRTSSSSNENLPSARRSDVDNTFCNHRSSLQIDRRKEQVMIELSRHSCSAINSRQRDVSWRGPEDDQNCSTRSPRYYAKQIVKQVKENVIRRRFGGDITNTNSHIVCDQQREHRRDEHLLSPSPSATYNASKPKKIMRTAADSAGGINSNVKVILETTSSALAVPPPPPPPPSRSGTTLKTTSLDTKNKQQDPRTRHPPPPPAVEVAVSKTKSSPSSSSDPPPPAYLASSSKQHQQDSKQSRLNLNRKVCASTIGKNGRGPPQLSSVDVVRNKKKEELFVRALPASNHLGSASDKKSRSTKPLSSDLILHHHGTAVPSLFALKKSDPAAAPTSITRRAALHNHEEQGDSQASSSNRAPPPTPISLRLSSNLSRQQNDTTRKDQHPNYKPTTNSNLGPHHQQCPAGSLLTHQATTIIPNSTTRAEFHYISRILKQSGIERDTLVSSFTKWFASSHPLNPTTFYILENEEEHSSSSTLTLRCNRRLMFDLVDEILTETLKLTKPQGYILMATSVIMPFPQMVSRPWCGAGELLHGFQLMRTIWTKVKGFPRANCKFLQDIDELVEMDLKSSSKYKRNGVESLAAEILEEEGERIVLEIEEEVMEGLMMDTALAVASLCHTT